VTGGHQPSDSSLFTNTGKVAKSIQIFKIEFPSRFDNVSMNYLCDRFIDFEGFFYRFVETQTDFLLAA
jgi:hypothetical protein